MTNTNYPSATPQSQPPKSNNTKNILIGVLAAGLLGTWGYFLLDKNKTNDQIQVEKQTASTALTAKDSLQSLYSDALVRLDSITGQNNNLQGQNSDLQKDIDAKKAEIRRILSKANASEAELKKARVMIAELNDQIGTLEAEVSRLTGENQQLTVANTQLQADVESKNQEIAVRTAEKEELTKTVDVGSTFSASNIQITPVNERKNGKEKVTSTAKKVDKLVVSFDVENRIAKSGPADLYIIVTAPDGKVVESGGGNLTTRTDGDKTYTSKVGLNYEQGTRKNVQLPLRQDDFLKGDYRIEVYHNGFKIGEGVRTLKKGGLFG